MHVLLFTRPGYPELRVTRIRAYRNSPTVPARSARTRSSSSPNATSCLLALVDTRKPRGCSISAHCPRANSCCSLGPTASAQADIRRSPRRPPATATPRRARPVGAGPPQRTRRGPPPHPRIRSDGSATARPAVSSSTSNAVNSDRTACALPANARSQPRTVDTARPSRAAIGRCPAPAAFNRSAIPMTSTPSARRHRHDTANSTCVTRQRPQRARRGRSTPTPRTLRSRA